MHGYCSTYVFMHNFIPTNVSVFLFLLKRAYLNTFSILHYFALTDPSALTYHN